MTRVRDPKTGVPLLCCWDDCGQFGQDEIRAQVRAEVDEGQGRPMVRYIFCSERHKAYWVHSTVSNGNLPAGMRNPLGLAGR